MKFEWEEIYSVLGRWGNKTVSTYRAKVFGGWVVLNENCSGDSEVSNTSCFIPDPEHKWNIKDE